MQIFLPFLFFLSFSSLVSLGALSERGQPRRTIFLLAEEISTQGRRIQENNNHLGTMESIGRLYAVTGPSMAGKWMCTVKCSVQCFPSI